MFARPAFVQYHQQWRVRQPRWFTYTLPSGYVYAGLTPASTITPAISPTVGATGTLIFSFTEIAELANVTVYFSVTNDLNYAGVSP